MIQFAHCIKTHFDLQLTIRSNRVRCIPTTGTLVETKYLKLGYVKRHIQFIMILFQSQIIYSVAYCLKNVSQCFEEVCQQALVCDRFFYVGIDVPLSDSNKIKNCGCSCSRLHIQINKYSVLYLQRLSVIIIDRTTCVN